VGAGFRSAAAYSGFRTGAPEPRYAGLRHAGSSVSGVLLELALFNPGMRG
jgi:hypothetical protein